MGAQALWGDDDQAFQLVDCLSATDQNALSGDQNLAKRFPETTLPRGGLLRLSQSNSGGLDGVDPVVLCATSPLLSRYLHDVFTGLSQHRDQACSEAAGPLQRPDAAARCAAHGPSQHPTVGRTVCRVAVLGLHSAGNGVEDGKVDCVLVGVTADDEVVLLGQHGHLPLSFLKLILDGTGLEEVTCRGSTVTGHASRRRSS